MPTDPTRNDPLGPPRDHADGVAGVPPPDADRGHFSGAEAAAASGGLVPFAEGVWLATAPVRFLGLHLTSTMTVLRLGGGDLLVHAPVALTAERRAAVEALGRVAHLYAPNLFHHLALGAWAAAFPEARLHAPRGLAAKEPGLRIDRYHGAAAGGAPDATLEPALAGVIDELPVEGFRLRETALFHRASGTLVVADLIHNVGRPTHAWTATYTRLMGFHDRIALSRVIRWTGFDDKKAARRSLDAILERASDRLILGHGAPLLTGGREALATGYTWLRG